MPEPRVAYQSLRNNGLQVSAPSLQRLYIDTGLALTDCHVKLDWIKDTQKLTLAAEGATRESLMLNWLEQLEGAFSTKRFLARRIVFDQFDGRSIKATLWGETHDGARHGSVTFRKPTQQALEVGEKGDANPEFFVRVFF